MTVAFQTPETPYSALVKVLAISGAASALVFIGLLGALGLIGWLLVFGVNEPRWKEQARLSGG